MRNRSSLFVVIALLFTACVHRPYYRELIGDAANQKEVTFRLLDAKTTQPLAGVPVRVSSGNEKISVVTDARGVFKLPVKKSFMDPYTVVEVVRPAGVERYTIERIKDEAPSAATLPEGQPSDAGV